MLKCINGLPTFSQQVKLLVELVNASTPTDTMLEALTRIRVEQQRTPTNSLITLNISLALSLCESSRLLQKTLNDRQTYFKVGI